MNVQKIAPFRKWTMRMFFGAQNSFFPNYLKLKDLPIMNAFDNEA
jgi:hypothetical protein